MIEKIKKRLFLRQWIELYLGRYFRSINYKITDNFQNHFTGVIRKKA